MKDNKAGQDCAKNESRKENKAGASQIPFSVVESKMEDGWMDDVVVHVNGGSEPL